MKRPVRYEIIDTRTGQQHEGGFFNRESAVDYCDKLNREQAAELGVSSAAVFQVRKEKQS